MLVLSRSQIQRAVLLMAGFHILIISASNYLVQLPIQVFGFQTTWGAISFPFVYLATDLTVRIFGQRHARQIIIRAMLPALMISYVIGVLYTHGSFQGISSITTFNSFVFRIAFASFAAYLLGQLIDITIFARIRKAKAWWAAPAASSVFGNIVDSLVFFSLAFYASTDPFMASHWPEIATVDYCFKLLINIVLFLPAYGVLLKLLQDRILQVDSATSVGKPA